MIRPPCTVVLAALLAACGEVSTGGSGLGPTASQSLELTLAVEDELESTTAALTVVRPGSPPVWIAPAGCPTQSGTADTDADGILDNATLSFTAPPCDGVFRQGSLQVSGMLDITDPNFASNQRFNLDYADLAWAYVDSTGDRDYTATRDGSRLRFGSADTVALTTVLTIVRQRPNRANATVSLGLTQAFTAATPGALLVSQPAPSGILRLSGTLRWLRSTEDWLLTVATPVPLVYDATCTATPKIEGGQLTLAGTINGERGVLRFIWSECGVEPIQVWTSVP